MTNLVYSLLVLSAPTAGHGARHAASFAHAAIASGHTIRRIFFLDEGVHCGRADIVYPQDETNPLGQWRGLSNDHGVELLLCVSSALKRGLLDEQEASRHEASAATIDASFSIGGLGQLIDATAHSDRLLSFGG